MRVVCVLRFSWCRVFYMLGRTCLSRGRCGRRISLRFWCMCCLSSRMYGPWRMRLCLGANIWGNGLICKCHSLSRSLWLLILLFFLSVLAAQMITILPPYWPSSGNFSLRKHIRIPTIPYKSRLESSVAFLCVLALISTFAATPNNGVILPYRSEEHILRTGIWTVHFGIDNGGRDSQLKMQQLIR